MKYGTDSVRFGGAMRRHLAEYLSLLYAKAEGHSEVEMARDICRIDPSIELKQATKIVKSRIKRAQHLADNPQRLLGEIHPGSRDKRHRKRPR